MVDIHNDFEEISLRLYNGTISAKDNPLFGVEDYLLEIDQVQQGIAIGKVINLEGKRKGVPLWTGYLALTGENKGKTLFNSNHWRNVYPFFNGLALVEYKEEGKYGYINLKGEEVTGPVYADGTFFQNGFAVVIKKDEENEVERNFYFINEKGERVLPKKDRVFPGGFNGARPFGQFNLAPVEDGSWGYINLQGEEVITGEYTWEQAHPFYEGLAKVEFTKKEEEGPWQERVMYITPTGQQAFEGNYIAGGNFSQGLAWVQREEDGKRIYINEKEGKLYSF